MPNIPGSSSLESHHLPDPSLSGAGVGMFEGTTDPILPGSGEAELRDKLDELHALWAVAEKDHFKLVWVVGSSAGHRSALVRAFAKMHGATVLNLGEALSQLFLDIPASLRAASAGDCFGELLDATGAEPLCLDRLEILFEPSLSLRPGELLKQASRHRGLIASWPGSKHDDQLVFGHEGHPAHCRLPCDELECQILEIDS